MIQKWLNKAYSRPFTTGVGLFLVVLFGFWLAVLRPTWQADRAYGSATELVSEQTEAVKTLGSEIERFGLWYKPEYLAGDRELLKQGSLKLDKAFDLVTKAGKASSVKEKYAIASEALLLLEKGDSSVSSNFDRIKKDLADYTALTEKAKDTYASLSERTAELSKNFGNAKERYEKESGVYLAKYTRSMQSDLSDAKSQVESAKKTLGKVPAYLPPEDDTGRSGDPRGTTPFFSAAEANLKQIGFLVARVDKDLSFQKEALDNAVPTTKLALEYTQKGQEHLFKVSLDYGLNKNKSLRLAYAKYGEAMSLLNSAQTALQTKVEGTYDYPLVYKDALVAIAKSKEAIREADLQVGLLAEAIKEINDIRKELEQISFYPNGANNDYSVLKKYHNPQAWRDVGKNAEEISLRIAEANRSLARAEVFADMNEQRFSDAVKELNFGFAAVKKVHSLRDDLHARRVSLEEARSVWPNTEQKAERTIADEKSEVESYGAYSSSASSDFSNAKSQLKKAQSAAGEKDYASAVDYARSAISLAEGTGHKAHEAYDDYQEEQARIAREQAEAAERAADAARRAAESSSQNSSNWGSSDNGSSGYGGSGGYSSPSDSGGYGSGSSSSDGGDW